MDKIRVILLSNSFKLQSEEFEIEATKITLSDEGNVIKAEDNIAGAVFFLAGSKTILYFFTLFFFSDCLTCFKYFKLVLIIG